ATFYGTLAIAWLLPLPAVSFPQFQQYCEKHSGRPVNCFMCHMNDDGPTGDGEGQIGSLKPEDLERLNKTRAQTEPGSEIDNPILNKFGNQILHKLGMKKVLELTNDPSKLPEALGKESDLDNDGIPDGQEFADGTDALNKFNGDPWKLMVINANRYKFQIILASKAVLFLDYGLAHLIKGIPVKLDKKEDVV